MSIFGFVPVPPSSRPVGDDQPAFGWDLDRDIRTITAMAERLTPYVYEDELYGGMPGDLAKLTIGGLVMRLQRLQAVDALLSDSQRAARDTAQAQTIAVRTEWVVHYEAKITREVKARIQTVENFLNDCVENQKICAENYASQMEKRVIVDALALEAAQINYIIEGLPDRLQRLDNAIRRYAEKGTFRWDSRLQAAYPEDPYWYLYSYVPKFGMIKTDK